MSLAIVPGSFDPMTVGHLMLVEKALERYDQVVVALMINPQKQYLFDKATRLEIAKRTVAHMERVSVLSDDGMLIDLYDRLGADAVCKGWRNDADYRYETEMAEWNRAHNPRFVTELIRADADYEEISSTKIREMLENGKLPSRWVHANAIELVSQKIKNGG